MLCEKCKNREATTHIKTVIAGNIKESHLCTECAAEYGYGDLYQNPLNQMLTSIFGDTYHSPDKQKRCECCGATLYDIKKSGKAFCPQCYETFLDELLPYIKRIHGSTSHTGKSLNKAVKKSKADTLSDLKEELKKLVTEEKYEQAAVIRDKIKEAEASGK